MAANASASAFASAMAPQTTAMSPCASAPNSLASTMRTIPKMGSSRDDRDAVIADLQRQMQDEQDKNRTLQDQYNLRVATFVKRDLQTKNRIEALEKRLVEQTENDDDDQMSYVQNMHRDVIKSLDNIQSSTAQQLQDQERTLLKAFNTKLQKVKTEMKNSDSKQGVETLESKISYKKVTDDLRQAQDMAQNFDKENLQLQAENQKLTEKLRNREDDREALKKELVMARREAARLKAMAVVRDGTNASGRAASPAGLIHEDEDPEPPKQQQSSLRQSEQSRIQQTHNRQFDREVRLRDAERRLKRLVAHERSTNDGLRKQEVSMLQQRTELEAMLRQCVDDVKAEIMRRRCGGQRSGSLPTGQDPSAATAPPLSSISVHDFDERDRERVLELLLSQQRVVQLLYQNAAQVATSGSSMQNLSQEPHTSLSASTKHDPNKEDEFAWLSDVPV